MNKIRRIICYLFGHRYKKAVSVSKDYDIYICTCCGRQLFALKHFGRR